MSITHYIRLLGEGHATHHSGTVLGVTDNEALVRSNRNVAHRAAAETLVARGLAEWVGIASGAPPPAPEMHQGRIDRHREEHADMLARHASEHRELMERHEREGIATAGLATAVMGI